MLQQGEWELSNSNSHSRLRSEGVGMPACVQSAVKRQREEDLDQMETFAKQVAEKCSQIQAISVQETSTLTQMLTTTAQQMDELDQTKAIKKQGVDKLDQMQLPERHRAEEESDHTETVVSQKVDNSEQAWTTSQFKHSLISEGASTDAKCEMDDQLTAEDNKPTESAVKPSLLSPPSSGEAMPDHMTRSTSVGKVEGTRRKAIPNKKSTKKPRPPKRIRDRLKRIAEGMLDDSLPPPEQSSFGDMLSGSGQTELKEETRPLEQREAVTNGDTQSGLESPGGSSTTTTSSHPPTRKQKSAGLLPLGGLVPTYHHG